MMALTCFTMAILPTYAQIGIYASIAITICRVMQCMSSMGEIVGAKVYITESTNPPSQYLAVSLISVFSVLGGVLALGVASLVISSSFNWRAAFFFGMIIAVVGGLARTYLREAPDFADAKKQLKEVFEKVGIDKNKLEDHPAVKLKVSKKTSIAYFLIECTWPLYFYVAYVYCGNILKDYGYSSEQIIHHNFITSIGSLLSGIILAYLTYKIYPLKILRALS
ncbi:MAG: MFS transporter [Candidatus Rickettsia vulgarisii]